MGGQTPDRMRTNKGLVQLSREAPKKGKVIAAIRHGPQLLIEAEIVRKKKATCYISVSTDLRMLAESTLKNPWLWMETW